MSYKCKITVLKKDFYPEIAEQYLANPKVGACDAFEIGQVFIIDDSNYGKIPVGFCPEAWESLCKYVFTQLSGGIVFKSWNNSPKTHIACCNDGSRPVVFKLEQIEV